MAVRLAIIMNTHEGRRINTDKNAVEGNDANTSNDANKGENPQQPPFSSNAPEDRTAGSDGGEDVTMKDDDDDIIMKNPKKEMDRLEQFHRPLSPSPRRHILSPPAGQSSPLFNSFTNQPSPLFNPPAGGPGPETIRREGSERVAMHDEVEGVLVSFTRPYWW
ncbi:hypothetical protein B0T26DRAFT_674903 [Lasiosphaeria miniovina]|uniref:Uncharacterized protein n=1 Tax=Lasiosphaeria miniovina TaxID=1954250 RepID=A0AA40E5L3_9PEZI|nr:uncharacterized protein B0T26DRAFT_674903 [Lasiosphaeria miniovina]KAK0723318.1 hypothetical protein B0T26DRAFT_674903 [Lasiosphaeria miniovina]